MQTVARIFVLVLVSGAILACKSPSQESTVQEVSTSENGLQSDFFDESLLLDGAIDIDQEFADAVCVGASEEDLAKAMNPRVLRGQVFAPAAKLAHRSEPPSSTLSLIKSAHALPLEGELPVGGVEVALVKIDNEANPVGDAIVTTTTTRHGHWCLRVPDEFDFATDLMLVASSPYRQLRRLAAHYLDRDISTQSEALIQLLLVEEIPITEIPPTTYLNLEVMSLTASDLINPVVVDEGADTTSTVEEIIKVLKEDARVSKAVERLKSL